MYNPDPNITPSDKAAWGRIGDLVDAIRTQYESATGSARLCEAWAREIVMQCQIIEQTEHDNKHGSSGVMLFSGRNFK